MFWGLILKANKRYTQVLEKPFHLSKAALDHSSSDADPVQVMYSHEDNSYLLCTLQKGQVMQCDLDLNFAEGDKLCFLTKGNGIVHLTGYLIPEDPYDAFDDEGGSEEESELEELDLRNVLKNKKKPVKEEAGKDNGKKQEVANSKKKAPVAESDDSDSDDEDFEIGEEQESDEMDTTALTNENEDDSNDDDEESGEEEEEGDSDEDESEDEEAAPPKAKHPKLDQQQQQNNKKQQQQNGVSNGQEKKNKHDQKDQKQKQKDGEKGQGQVQKLQGGLLVQDLKAGNGAEAKPGRKIQVYYEGRIKANNKVFDSAKKGPGFKMTLGRGEVIKGWDIGLNGMKVGGKRRLTIPPQLGYGAKGNPPVIPANSTLVFDVELKNVM